MIIPAPDSVAITILGISIYWYGIIMAFAILSATLVGNTIFNKFSENSNKDFIIAIAPIVIIVGILGARLYFCTLSHEYYFSHPLEICDIRQGGLSIHGALIFGILALIISSYVKKVSILKVLDIMAISAVLGQSIGRWGNYFNSEAYGMPVAGQTWGSFIPLSKRVEQYADFSLFHPTFLYESILDFTCFCLLLCYLLKSKTRKSGTIFFLYLIFYAVIRFIIEQIRVDSALNIGTIPIAEIVSLLMLTVGVVGILIVNLPKKSN
jgi:phosphatidylglycerol:prolipoprotein diacylglycerol transferase